MAIGCTTCEILTSRLPEYQTSFYSRMHMLVLNSNLSRFIKKDFSESIKLQLLKAMGRGGKIDVCMI